VKAEVGQVMGFRGLERIPMEEASAGDIVLVTGVEETAIGVTFADPLAPEALPMLRVDEPTLTMNFQVNTSPFAGQEGRFVTSRQIRERLFRELQGNVALRRAAPAVTVLVAGGAAPAGGGAVAVPTPPQVLPRLLRDRPGLTVKFLVNTSAAAGLVGRGVGGRHIRVRGFLDPQRDVALQ